MRPPEELLYDSEASLRLVDHAIEELNETGADLDSDARGFLEHVMAQPGGFAELSRTLLRAYAETVGIVQRLRESCGMVGPAGDDKMQQMNGRLREIATATETATTGILDSVTRAIAVVDKLDAASESERAALMVSLREELGGVTHHLQFQDITAQQLGHIASLLSEMRQQITQIITIFAQPAVNFSKEDHGAFDPNASTSPAAADARQAVADEIFAVRAERKTA
jgi:chemotaxis regulatin CheY-phosphate phosphatase CheZ